MPEFTILPRDLILPEMDSLDSLLESDRGWLELRSEGFRPIIIPRFVGKNLHSMPTYRPFLRSEYRIPPLCLSKYSQVTILPEQVMATSPGIASADTFEELVFESDEQWFHPDHAFEHHGKLVSIPRLRYHQFSRGPNSAEIGKVDSLDVVRIGEPALSLLSWWGGMNLSHWLVDCLPRLWAYPLIQDPNLRVVIPDGRAPFISESLAIMGIEGERIIRVNNGYQYKFETLYVPSRVGGHYTFFSDEIIDFYRQMETKIPNFEAGSAELVYISRRDSDARRCVNEDELESALKERGFRIVMLTDLSFAERLSLMAGCRFVISACGAGLASCLMMPNQSVILVMGTPEMNKNAMLFVNIASAKDQEVLIYNGTPCDNDLGRASEWTVDVPDFVKNVDRAIATIAPRRRASDDYFEEYRRG